MKKKITNKHELLDKIVADYTRRTREGAAPEIAKYKRKYPALAEEIEDLLSSVAMIEGLKSEATQENPLTAKKNSDLSQLKQLGDYVLIREVGRGGMGVVFEAVHQSLGRRVALKVMLEKELESDKNIARFRREAQAAAKLHHTNIVSVFGVGEANGYHYYVMEYIDGISLKSAVRSLTGTSIAPNVDGSAVAQTEFANRTIGDGHSSTADDEFSVDESEIENSEVDFCQEFDMSRVRDDAAEVLDSQSNRLKGIPVKEDRYQWVGKIGAQVADALGYSHELGILHRDIKPANLMLDDQGQVWITDFGLVKMSDEESITKTGAVLGTPQYLAPESLKGNYDQQSETYCLGLSLYELATLKPAFATGSHAEVFHRIIHETPSAPAKVDASIPRDLATIIEKATNKDPSQRYESAFDLRDDLRAFVEDRPISARRPSLIEQAARWGRKNPLVASLAGLSALLVCSTAIVASSAWAVTNQAYSRLKVQSGKTEAARKEAVENEQLAVENENRAIENFNRAEANVNLMVETFDELFIEFLQKDSKGTAGKFDFDGFNELAGIEISIDESDASYLKKMANFYERFARQNSENKNLLNNAAKGWRRVANINFLIGDDDAAIASYEKAVACCMEILDQNRDSTDALFNLVSTRSEMSNAVRRSSAYRERNSKPLKLIKENLLAIEEHADHNDPQVRFALAETLTSLASAEVCRLAAEGVIDWERLGDENRRPPNEAKPRLYDKQAKRYVTRAVTIANELVMLEPEKLEYRLLLGKSHCSLGALERNFGETELAIESLYSAVKLFQSLAEEHPDNPDYQYQVAVTLLLMPAENSDAISQAQIAEVQRIADSLVQKSPNPEYVQLKIISRLKMADFQVADNQSRLAIQQLHEGVELFKISNLKGPARGSMLRVIGQTGRRISKSLPPPQRREFVKKELAKLKEEFELYRPYGQRPRGSRR